MNKSNLTIVKPTPQPTIQQRRTVLIKGEKRFYEAKKLLREEGEAGVRLVVDTFTSDEIDYILMRLKNEASDWLAKYDGAMRWREIYNHESWKMGELLNEQSEGNKTL